MPRCLIWNLLTGFTAMLITLSPGTSNAQQPPAPFRTKPAPALQKKSTLDHEVRPESDCSNGIDDNGNGLSDSKDFHCYLGSTATMQQCAPTNIVWASSNWGLHWLNLETLEERLIIPRDELTYDDITWASNGKLYGAERSGSIYEIDPHNYNQSPVGKVGDYYYSNGMTGDADGNIYLTSFKTSGECDVVKFNPATKNTQLIVRLGDNNLTSAGDLCFINGNLYVSCLDNTIAKINLVTKQLHKLKLVNSPVPDGPYGMTTLGDGYLYVSNNTAEIYKVDIRTMEVSFYGKFSQPDFFTLGLTSYTDLCNGPACRGTVKITANRPPPYCSGEGVPISAEGSGIKGESSYTWSLPGGSTMPGNSIVADRKGSYFVSYHSTDGNCSVIDSITLDIIEQPWVSLGNDTFICSNLPLKLTPKLDEHVTAFRWDDGSDHRLRAISAPGIYWMEAMNQCGTTKDTVIVQPKIDDCECFLYTPNAFSPNGDQKNDVFTFKSNCAIKGSIRIFNRWGGTVFSSDDIAKGWDGRSRSTLQPAGIYIYNVLFEYVNRPGKFVKKGTISLVH